MMTTDLVAIEGLSKLIDELCYHLSVFPLVYESGDSALFQ